MTSSHGLLPESPVAGGNLNTPPLQPNTFVHIGKTANVLLIKPPDASAERHFAEDIEKLRRDILDTPNDTCGLNISRVNTFRDQIGAPEKPIHFLNEEDFKGKRSAVMDRHGDSKGVYSNILGLAIVQRDKTLEALNGPEITEGFAIHEIAHSSHFETPIRAVRASSGRLLWKKTEIVMSAARTGFSVASRPGRGEDIGGLLEEGYAEYERGLYVRQNDLIDAFTSGGVNYQMAEGSGIPLHYFYKQDDEGRPSLTFAPGALVATILEAFIAADPSLQTSMREARQSAAGLRTFIQHLNSIKPGLYSQLQHVDDIAAAKLLGKIKRNAG